MATETEQALASYVWPNALSTLAAPPEAWELSPDDQLKQDILNWRIGQQIPQWAGGTWGSGGAVPPALKAMASDPLGLKDVGVGAARRP